MGIVSFGEIRLPVKICDVHFLHQGPHRLSSDWLAFQSEQTAEHPAAGKRVFQMQFVDASHEGEIGG